MENETVDQAAKQAISEEKMQMSTPPEDMKTLMKTTIEKQWATEWKTSRITKTK